MRARATRGTGAFAPGPFPTRTARLNASECPSINGLWDDKRLRLFAEFDFEALSPAILGMIRIVPPKQIIPQPPEPTMRQERTAQGKRRGKQCRRKIDRLGREDAARRRVYHRGMVSGRQADRDAPGPVPAPPDTEFDPI